MGERTKELFEKIEGFPEAELLPEESFDYRSVLSKMAPRHRAIFNLYFKLSGFISFNKQLSQNFGKFASSIDLKGGALYSPVISATIALCSDSRNLSAVERAAMLICGTIELKNDLFSGKLSPDFDKGRPLEMGQYPNLFATSQIVESKKARLYKSDLKDQITVISNGNFYILDLTNIDCAKDLNIVIYNLKEIVFDSKTNNAAGFLSPGVITAANNPVQIRIFNKLIKKEVNRSSLRLLRESLFTVCLDIDSYPETYEEAAKIAHSENQFNRWFHSSLQLVVFGNSKAGIIINFSANIGGNNMMRAASEIYKRSQLYKNHSHSRTDKIEPVRFKKLLWEIDKEQIKNAEISLNKIKDHDNDSATFNIEQIGIRNFPNYEKQIVPIFVLALHSASKIFINHHPGIIQFLTTSRYRYMDLTRPNVTTDEAMDFIDYIGRESFDVEQAKEKLSAALESQLRKMRESRRQITINEQISYFIMTRKGLSKIYNNILHWIRIILLWLTGFFKLNKTEIIISHPQIFKEAPIIGRPGIRIPYAKYFGLHYQIMEGNITVTMMPGINWMISNEKFIRELENQLKKIEKIIKS
jgi:hypothetical protein